MFQKFPFLKFMQIKMSDLSVGWGGRIVYAYLVIFAALDVSAIEIEGRYKYIESGLTGEMQVVKVKTFPLEYNVTINTVNNSQLSICNLEAVENAGGRIMSDEEVSTSFVVTDEDLTFDVRFTDGKASIDPKDAIGMCGLNAWFGGNWVRLDSLAQESTDQDPYELGRAAANSGRIKEALAHWEPLVKKNDPRAMFSTALVYAKGDQVPRDIDKAIDLAGRSKSLGNEKAKLLLTQLQQMKGDRSIRSNGAVTRTTSEFVNDPTAKVSHNWSKKEAIDRAQHAMRRNDIKSALIALSRAAELGDISSAYSLGSIYLDERFKTVIKVDLNKAKYWLLVASEGGHKAAMDRLARLMATKGDFIDSYVWFYRIALEKFTSGEEAYASDNLFHDFTAQSVREAEARLTYEELQVAKAKAKNWCLGKVKLP